MATLEPNAISANSIIQRNLSQNPSSHILDNVNKQAKLTDSSLISGPKSEESNLKDKKSDKERQKSKERKKKHKKRHSRSNSSSESRHKKKDKKSKKHKRRDSQSQQNKGRTSKSRQRHRSRHRKDSKDRKHRKNDHSRSRSKDNHRKQTQIKVSPKQTPKMPQQVPFQDTSAILLPGQRRRRERSRSPREYYKRNLGGGDDAQFWDSHSWVPKLNYISNASASAIINTKKMRRLQITNVPLQMGLRSQDINEAVTQFMIKNYLTDPMNNSPILRIDMFEADRSVAMELSSVEQTCRICKLQKVELFKGSFCGIIRLGDSMYGSSLVSQAQTAAKAQAAAFAAMSILQNKATKFDISGGMVSIQSSHVLRVVNAVTPYMCDHLSQQEWKEYYEDLIEGFEQHGKVKHSWLVKKSQRMVCAQPGNLFVEFQKKEQAQKTMESMQGRAFDERQLKLYFIPDAIYQNHFKPNAIK